MKRSGAVFVAALAAPLFFLASCGSEPAEGPPPIHLGDSLCVECNMIISDARFATATVSLDERGRRSPLLFDDFNCQAAYEAERPDLKIIERWAHDHASSRPIRTESASFVHAERLRTPMASQVAAFEAASAAESFAGSLGGEVLVFDAAWERLQKKPCCGGACKEEVAEAKPCCGGACESNGG